MLYRVVAVRKHSHSIKVNVRVIDGGLDAPKTFYRAKLFSKDAIMIGHLHVTSLTVP
jgi:hypothetical protein